MGKHADRLNGLEFSIRIDEMRGCHGACVGQLVDKDTCEVVFESEFPSYKDAYWALMEMDGDAWLGSPVRLS